MQRGCFILEEVRHSHTRYALMNIRKRSIQSEMLWGFFVMLKSVLLVRSNIACLCDLQMAFMWLLRARWMAMIEIDSFKNWLKISPTRVNPARYKLLMPRNHSWSNEMQELRNYLDNHDHMLIYMTSLVSDLLWFHTCMPIVLMHHLGVDI